MAAIDPASWYWPTTSTIDKLLDTSIPSEARAAYILGAMLPNLGGSAQTSALRYLSNNVPLLVDTFGQNSPELNTMLASINTAMAQPANAAPGVINVQDQRQRALKALSSWVTPMYNQSPDKFAELSWLNNLAGLGNQQPKTRGEWAQWNRDMQEQIAAAPTGSSGGDTSAWANIGSWFANPSYTAPMVVANPSKNLFAGSTNWWG